MEGKYAAGNPRRQDLEAKISSLRRFAKIRSDEYAEVLRARLTDLQAERAALGGKYAAAHPRLSELNARIRFLEQALKAVGPPGG